MKKSKSKKKLKKKSNKCSRCGGTANGDGYFISKCLCAEFDEIEGGIYDDL